MALFQPQIAAVCEAFGFGAESATALLEQLEVMHLARAKSRGYNAPGFWVSDNLRFLSVPLFLAAVRVLLLFWGRSTGHSVASTTTTSKIKSLLVKAFFAWQRECTGAQQGILDRMNGAADGGLAQAVGVSNVGVSAVLTPVHQIRANTSKVIKSRSSRQCLGGRPPLGRCAARAKDMAENVSGETLVSRLNTGGFSKEASA